MQTTPEFVSSARAEILARLICKEPVDEDARRALEQVERVAQAVETDRQRAIVWLRQILKHEWVTLAVPVALGFDRWLVEAADTLVMRHRESVDAYARRVAECSDADVLAVAVAAIDDTIGDRIEEQPETLAAHGKARGVLKRAADALANQPPGDALPAGRMADDRPTPPRLRNALMALVEHANGARNAMMRMVRPPANVPWGSGKRPSLDDMHLLVTSLHGLLRDVAMLIIDVTAREDENTHADRMTLRESRTKGVNLLQGMQTIAQTIARRLRDFNEAQHGERPENGKVLRQVSASSEN
ncbi:MAG: hypothetical protein OXG04_03450 [Acidobacteria bacterium]|nr:hypothetical protein [Acidobacteriota bacterium]